MNFYQVSYYGLLAERRTVAAEKVRSSAHTPRDLYRELDRLHDFRLPETAIRVAVNDAFANWDDELRAGDRLAFLPPMSGG